MIIFKSKALNIINISVLNIWSEWDHLEIMDSNWKSVESSHTT